MYPYNCTRSCSSNLSLGWGEVHFTLLLFKSLLYVSVSPVHTQTAQIWLPHHSFLPAYWCFWSSSHGHGYNGTHPSWLGKSSLIPFSLSGLTSGEILSFIPLLKFPTFYYIKVFFNVNHSQNLLLNLLQYCFCFVLLCGHKACGVSAPQPGTEPAPLEHWKAKS